MRKHNITTIENLKERIAIPKADEEALRGVIDKHPMKIPQHYMSLINPDDPDDPIRKMAVPSLAELDTSGLEDTSGEASNTVMCGLQHKYDQTVLLLSVNACAMYCRHCFRKRMVGLSNDEIMSEFNNAVKYIEEHPEVTNILISGGDAFMLPAKIIHEMLIGLKGIGHLTYIRFGTRIPVVYPERIIDNEDGLLTILTAFSTPTRRIHISTQFNHPKEINAMSVEAIRLLLGTGCLVNNQTVLLKGVNDNPSTLAYLQRKLVAIGVNPYYVFQCRPVKRVKNHFQVPLAEGIKIVDEARVMLDGVCKRFRYIMAHEKGKTEILGVIGDEMYFKQHQAKDRRDDNRLFRRKITNYNAGWLDELEE
jgi:KamA family protein